MQPKRKPYEFKRRKERVKKLAKSKSNVKNESNISKDNINDNTDNTTTTTTKNTIKNTKKLTNKSNTISNKNNNNNSKNVIIPESPIIGPTIHDISLLFSSENYENTNDKLISSFNDLLNEKINEYHKFEFPTIYEFNNSESNSFDTTKHTTITEHIKIEDFKLGKEHEKYLEYFYNDFISLIFPFATSSAKNSSNPIKDIILFHALNENLFY